jgi:hypothetical protein
MELITDSSPLQSGWLRHCLEEICHCSDVLTGFGEHLGLLTSIILIDATLNIMGSKMGCSAITVACSFSLEGGLELL